MGQVAVKSACACGVSQKDQHSLREAGRCSLLRGLESGRIKPKNVREGATKPVRHSKA